MFLLTRDQRMNKTETKQGVSIVWDKHGKFFQIWAFDYEGNGKVHAENVAKQIGGTFKHIEPENLL